MTITAKVLSTGGSTLATQAIAVPAVWTRLTDLDNAAPQGGAFVHASSDAEAFRISCIPPESTMNTNAADYQPRDNGDYIPGPGVVYDNDLYGAGWQVWVKQA